MGKAKLSKAFRFVWVMVCFVIDRLLFAYRGNVVYFFSVYKQKGAVSRKTAPNAKTRIVVFFYALSFKMTSWAPPSMMLVEDTNVIFAFFCRSSIESVPQLHIVERTLLSVPNKLLFILPA